LYRLLRGAGPKGLSGIKAKTKLGTATLLRPLLNITKAEILEYAQSNNLNWLQDQTNHNNNFDRNYIRNTVLPVMLQRWPAAIANINRAAELCDRTAGLISQQAASKLELMLLKDNTLDLLKLSQESQHWQHEVLRLWLAQVDLTPSLQQLEIISAEVIAARIDAQPEYVIAKWLLKRSNNKLYLLPNEPLPISSHGRKAKKIFQQHGIPPWERAKYPLVFVADKLVAIVGLWKAKSA
jgi:tRNA(Ile)-lysidine synthase